MASIHINWSNRCKMIIIYIHWLCVHASTTYLQQYFHRIQELVLMTEICAKQSKAELDLWSSCTQHTTMTVYLQFVKYLFVQGIERNVHNNWHTKDKCWKQCIIINQTLIFSLQLAIIVDNCTHNMYTARFNYCLCSSIIQLITDCY